MMNTQDMTITEFLRLLWRRRWIVVTTTALALVAGIVATILLSQRSNDAHNEYQASVTTRIELSGIPATGTVFLLGSANTFSRNVGTHIGLIRSKTVLENAAKILQDAAAAQPSGTGANGAAATEPVHTLDTLRQSVRASQVQGTNDTIQISATASDPAVAERILEAVILAYRQFVIDDRLRATNATIDALRSGVSDSSTAGQLQVLLERAANIELVRVSDVASSGAAELESDTPGEVTPSTSLAGITFDLEVSATRLETAAATLNEIEGELSGGSLSVISTLQAALGMVQDSTAGMEDAARALADAEPRAGIVAGLNVLESISSPLNAAASQLDDLRRHPGVPAEDRTEIERAWSQVLVVADASNAVQADAQDELDNNTPTFATRTQLISQLRSGAANLDIAVRSIRAARPSQTDASVFARLAQAEGQLSSLADEMIAGADSISAGSVDSSTRISEAIDFLREVEAQLTEVMGEGQGPVAIGQVERAMLGAAVTAINDAANRMRQARTASAPEAALNILLPLGPKLAAASGLLTDVINSGASGDLISTDALNARVQGSREAAATVAQGLRGLLGVLDATAAGETSPETATALERASADLATHAAWVRSRGDILEATASAVSSPSGASRLTQLATEMRNVASSLDAQSVRFRDLNQESFGLPDVRMTRISSELRSMSTAAEEAADMALTLLPSEQLPAESLPDSSELSARLRLLQAGLLQASNDLAPVAGEPGAALLAERLKASSAQVEALVTGIEGVETSRINEVNTVLQVQKDLELARLRPSVSLDTTVREVSDSLGVWPFDPRVLMSAAGGLLLGILGALTIEFMDRSVRRPEDMQRLHGIPSLGAIPVGVAKGNPHPPEVTDDRSSLFAEAVHQMTTLMEDRIEHRPFIVLVTSPSVREGKTMTAINLARSLALRGRKVLLIDVNFRKPDASKVMGVLDHSGLADSLANSTNPLDSVAPVDNLYVLAAGSSSSHPVELVSGPEMAGFITRAQERFDAIVMDGPPAIGFAEIGPLVNCAGKAVLVARSGKTDRRRLLEASRTLSEKRVVGTVLNFARPSDLKYLDHGEYTKRNKKRRAGMIPVSHFRFWRN